METKTDKRRASSVPVQKKRALVLDCVEVTPLPPRKRSKYDVAPPAPTRQTRSTTDAKRKAGKTNAAAKKTPPSSKRAPKSTDGSPVAAQKPTSKRGRRASISGAPPRLHAAPIAQLGIGLKPKRLPPRSRFRTRSASPADEPTSLTSALTIDEPPSSSKASRKTRPHAPPTEARVKEVAKPTEASTTVPASSCKETEVRASVHRDVPASGGLDTDTEREPSPDNATSPRALSVSANDITAASAPPQPTTDEAISTQTPRLPPSPPPSDQIRKRVSPKRTQSLVDQPLSLPGQPSTSRSPSDPPSAPAEGQRLKKAKTESAIDVDAVAMDFAMVVPEWVPPDGGVPGVRHIFDHMHHALSLESGARRRLEKQLSAELKLRVTAEREAERLRAEVIDMQQEVNNVRQEEKERRERKEARRRERRAAGLSSSDAGTRA